MEKTVIRDTERGEELGFLALTGEIRSGCDLKLLFWTLRKMGMEKMS